MSGLPGSTKKKLAFYLRAWHSSRMNITGTIRPYGSTYILNLSGDAKHLAVLVNHLINYGAVMPLKEDDDYKDGESTSVNLSAYRDNLKKGLQRVFGAQLSREIGPKWKGKRDGFKHELNTLVEGFLGSLVKESSGYVPAARRGSVFDTGGTVDSKPFNDYE